MLQKKIKKDYDFAVQYWHVQPLHVFTNLCFFFYGLRSSVIVLLYESHLIVILRTGVDYGLECDSRIMFLFAHMSVKWICKF